MSDISLVDVIEIARKAYGELKQLPDSWHQDDKLAHVLGMLAAHTAIVTILFERGFLDEIPRENIAQLVGTTHEGRNLHGVLFPGMPAVENGFRDGLCKFHDIVSGDR